MAGLDYIRAPRADPAMTAYVSPVFTNNIITRQFNTIEDAIDYGITKLNPTVDWDEAFVIRVSPGKYTERLTTSHRRIYIVSDTLDFSNVGHPVIIYNTGLDDQHYPIDTSNLNLIGISIITDAGGVYSRFNRYCRFSVCAFENGHFIENTTSSDRHTNYFRHCQFTGNAFTLEGVAAKGRYISFRSCIFSGTETIFGSTCTDPTGTVKVKFGGCHINTELKISGEWSILSTDTEVYGTGHIDFGSATGDIDIYSTILHGGVNFSSETTGQKKIANCICRETPAGEADITADVDIYDVDYVNNVQDHGLSGKIHTVSDVVNVGEGAVNRYRTVQDAIDSLSNGGVIFLEPGTYTEQIHSTAPVHIQGHAHEGVPAVKSTILYNTGADSTHWPLGGDDTDVFTISDVTIKTDAGGVIGKLSGSSFTGVVFQNGHFIEATANQAMLMGLADCSFKDSMAFNLTGVGSGGLRAMTIIGCYFGDHTTHWVMNSTHTDTLVIVKNTIFHKFYPDVGGNWKVEFSDSHGFGTSRSVISTTNKIAYIQCILSNGLHFTSNPADTIIQLCTFNDSCGYTITGADITAALDVTGVNYVQNVQQNGLAGEIKILDPIKNVGANAVNRYLSIQDAIDSITTSGIIELYQSFTGLAELTIPNNTKVTIYGKRTYSLAFTADIVELGLGEELILNNLSQLTGGNVEINGNNAEFHAHACPCGDNTLQILVTSGTGSKVHLRNANITGATGCSPLQVNSVDTAYLISYSRLTGATGQPALEFTVEADDKLRSRFSTYVHGDGGANAPITYTGANKVNVAVYLCGLNAAWNADDFTNTIGSSGIITDPNIDF